MAANPFDVGKVIRARSDQKIDKMLQRLVAQRAAGNESSGGVWLPDDPSRPRRGLAPDAAFARWANPAAVAAMEEYADGNPWTGKPVISPERQKEYVKRRRAAEQSLLDRLRDVELAASVIPEFGSRREVLDPSVFDVMWIDYGFEEIVGNKRRFLSPEIFEPQHVPANVREVPLWLAELIANSREAFQHDADYKHITLNGRSFALGSTQAKVIEALHQASVAEVPWVHGKILLAEAGSGSRNVGDLFKSQSEWRELIDSDGRGRYRLKLPSG